MNTVKTLHHIAGFVGNHSWCVLVVVGGQADGRKRELPALMATMTNPSNLFWFTWHHFNHWVQFATPAVRGFLQLLPFDESPAAIRNVGYIYTILHGAKYVLEVPRGCIMADYSNGWWDEVLSQIVPDPTPKGLAITNLGMHIFNPYPLLLGDGANDVTVPRGFPSSHLNNSYTHGSVAFIKRVGEEPYGDQDMKDILKQPGWKDMFQRLQTFGSITQFVVHQTKTFDPMNGIALMVPSHAFAPFLVQDSTPASFLLSDSQTLWSLLLPCSLSGEGWSDVWRSFVTQAMFRDVGSRVLYRSVRQPEILNGQHLGKHVACFGKPQELDVDSHVPDMLLEFLQEWCLGPYRSNGLQGTVYGRMEELWNGLARAKLLDAKDVLLVRLWCQILLEHAANGRPEDFPFPKLRPRVTNVVVMGQFNWAHIPIAEVIFWVQKYKEYFVNVIVRGPFPNETLQVLSSNGIVAHGAMDDQGYYSPLQNMMLTLEEVHESNQYLDQARQPWASAPPAKHGYISGVLYVHDDGLLNMTHFYSMASDGQQGYQHGIFPTDAIISVHGRSWVAYSMDSNLTRFNRVGLNETFTEWAPFYFSVEKLSWFFASHCLGGQVKVATHPNSSRYQDSDGMIHFPGGTQSDFLYVPVRVAPEFAHAARLHLQDPPVFLECAFPTVVDMILKTTNTTVSYINLCTTYENFVRGSPMMILQCVNVTNEPRGVLDCVKTSEPTGLYHPFKIRRGLEVWNDMFDFVNL